MLHKEATRCRQSPLQKAAGYGEDVLRVFGTAKGLWEAGKAAYGAAQTVAPYIAAAASAL